MMRSWLKWIVLGAPRRQRLDPNIPLVRVDQLPALDPSSGPVRLEVYHLPMQLAALVLAPSGRDARLPEGEALSGVVDHLVPRFAQIVDYHQPRFARWPAQLSTRGFVRAFFREVELPGKTGQGTGWCALAGPFQAGLQQVLAGLICRSADPNQLGQIVIQRPTQWLDVLRIRDAER